MHTHGQAWTNELIAESIMDVVNTLELKHMPTRVEIHDFYGNEALTNRISKTFGYYGWAEKLGLSIKSNDTLTGKLSEKFAAGLLKSYGYEVLQMVQNHPYDLLINQAVKIDVKYSNLCHGNQGGFYSFALRKKYPTCDIYMLIANNDLNQKAVYFVPAKSLSQTQLSIGSIDSKYHKYLNRYDIIDQYLKLYSEIT